MMKRNRRLPIFYYAFHSKPQATDKLHIIVHSHTRNPRGLADQQADPSLQDYGQIVESECGLKGILLKSDKDAVREDDFEGMGLKHFREKFSDIDIIYFFMPPVLRVSMPLAIAQEEEEEERRIIPRDKVCETCKNILKANVRRATTVGQEQKEGEEEQQRRQEEVGRQRSKEEERKGGRNYDLLFCLSFYL
jgi:hypothetical protein